MKPTCAWETYSKDDLERVNATAAAYKTFLKENKTERECTRSLVQQAKALGFREFSALSPAERQPKPNDKFFFSYKGKMLIFFVIGNAPLTEGFNVLGAHMDSPRLDLKQRPLSETDGLAYFDTHYYGGVKKYQWLTIPLALHGVVVKKDGSVIDFTVGEKEDDPVFGITDLLIHLSKDQLDKKALVFIEGEQLNILAGHRPEPAEDGKDDAAKVKNTIKKLLLERYGMDEEDFISAEIEAVPAYPPRDFGLDASMIAAYGHDDRCCAYACIDALFSMQDAPARTSCVILTDKEEIGSVGATGMCANNFENAAAELLFAAGFKEDIYTRRALAMSRMLSCDVTGAYDPLYASAFEKGNEARLGYGVCLTKYTGSRGKSGANDANAEYIAQVRRVFQDGTVCYQTGELGKVDQGGGGTIAYICARYGIDVIDCGIPVLSMHAPYEVISKADLYETCKAYAAFLRS